MTYTHQLASGHIAIVDDEDAGLFEQFTWQALQLKSGHIYVQGRAGGRKLVLMHRYLLGARPGQYVDHKNHHGLDNRRRNLRLSSQKLNIGNARHWKHNTSGFRGVSFIRSTGRWRAYIVIDGRQRWLGSYDNPIDAARAFNAAALEVWGEIAVLNHIPDTADAGMPDPLSARFTRKLTNEVVAE